MVIKLLANQYTLVQGSREVVISFCEGFKEADFILPVNDFGRGSIRDTLVHIANVYEFWIGHFAMRSSRETTETGLICTVQDIRNLFSKGDEMGERFLQENNHRPDERIVGEIPSLHAQKEYFVLQLMTHVMTHEFHHKGQIMTMGRMLGYTPPDADVIRF